MDEAAIREALEETGLHVRCTGWLTDATFDKEGHSVRLTFLQCRPLAGGEPAAPFRWVAFQQLKAYPMPPANAGVVQILNQPPP
jgi:8-oxo-dGTP pyrophosphatase MutT (NUDIX family)